MFGELRCLRPIARPVPLSSRSQRARNRILAAAVAYTAVARADDPTAEPGVTVSADRVASERARAEATPRFVTSVDVRERGATAEGVGTLLGEVPGLYARSSGDGLSPTGVSLRGAPAAQVVVALDGMVLNDGVDESVDLSLFPPALIERIDVYRGAAPVRLGVAGLGGTIELFTRAGTSRPQSFVTVGGGSFGARRFASVTTASFGPLHVLAAINYRGTQGTFDFYDTHGTTLATDDDTVHPRANNQSDAIDLLTRACVDGARWRGCVLFTAGDRERGLPGPGAAQFTGTHLAQSRYLARATSRWTLGRHEVDAWLGTTGRHDHFTDYRGSIVPGSPQDSRTEGHVVEAGVHARAVQGVVALEPVVRGRWERYGAHGTDALGDSDRLSLLAGADALVTLGPVEVLPAFALDVVRDAANGPTDGVTRVLASPRVAVRWRIDPRFELRGGGAHLERAPTLPELFGVPGLYVASPALRSETSNSVDAGAIATIRTNTWNFRGEVVGYYRVAHDLITFVRSGPLALKALNLDGADVRGLECAVRLAWREHVGLTASYALTDARSRTGVASTDDYRVPSVPLHEAYVRLDGRYGPVRVWTDVSYASGIFYDTTSLLAAPPRVLWAASVAFAVPRTHGFGITLRAENLLDSRDGTVSLGDLAHTVVRAPVADYAGYPIAGRSFFAALTYVTE